MSGFVASICEALPEFDRERVEAAIPVVKAGRFLPRPALLQKLREHLEERVVAVVPAPPAVETDNEQICRLIRDMSLARVRKNQAETQEFIYFCSYTNVLYAWAEVYRRQQMTIEALMEYIANCPAQSEHS